MVSYSPFETCELGEAETPSAIVSVDPAIADDRCALPANVVVPAAEPRGVKDSSAHRPELPGIQYVRGIAALLVLVDHAEFMIGMDKYYGSYLANGFLTKGFVGVDLFFVLSGFIIVYVTAPRSSSARQTLSVGDFLSRRFVRIVPFLWFCVVAHALLKLLTRKEFEPVGYLISLTLWPIGDPRPAQVWTLRHELLFYLFFAFGLNSRIGKGALCLFFLSPLAWWGWRGDGSGVGLQFLDFLFSRDNVLFGLGSLLGLAYVKRWMVVPKLNIGFGSLLAIGALLLWYVQASGYDRSSLAGIFQTGLLCTGILAISLAATSANRSPLQRTGKLLGDASYAIYLTHDMFISAVLAVLIKRAPGANLWFVFVLAVATAIVGGIGIHRWIEMPLIECVKRWLKRRAAAPRPERC